MKDNKIDSIVKRLLEDYESSEFEIDFDIIAANYNYDRLSLLNAIKIAFGEPHVVGNTPYWSIKKIE